MRRFNVFSFYKLGASVAALRLIGWLESDKAEEVLFSAKQQLGKLGSEKFAALEVLSNAASMIAVDIAAAQKQLAKTGKVYGDEEGLLIKSVNDFEIILEAQTPSEHTYTVEQLRGYSMPILVDQAELNFSPKTVTAVGKEVVEDIRQAGRCLAFELPTAAGIHMMRAFEKVFRRFYKVSMGKDSGTTDIYKLIKDLRDHSAVDPKILNVLDQIRDLHRNPLAHEVFLDTEEAVDLFHIAESAISAMAKKL